MHLPCFMSCFLLWLLIQFSACKPTSTDAQTNYKYPIQKERLIPISKGLSSFNLDGFYFLASENDQCESEIKQITPAYVRFPGGTLSNYYHYDSPGYGLRQEDLNLTEGDQIKHAAEKYFKKNSQALDKKGESENYIVPLKQLCINTSSEIVLTLNLFSSNESELDSFLRKLKQERYPIAFIELGNEYFFKAYQGVFPTVDSYIKKAQLITERCRFYFPKTPVGVCVSDYSAFGFDVKGLHQMRLKNWNDGISKESFYDAIIIHNYSRTKACSNEATEENIKCILNENDEHIYVNFSESMTYYRKMFSGKPIWITEWNTSRPFEVTCNTFLQGLYYAEFMFKMMEYPDIQLATYHNLLGGGCGYNMLKKMKQGGLKSVSYEVAQLISPIFQNESYMVESQSDIENTSSSFFIKTIQTKKTRYVYFINKTGQSKIVPITDIIDLKVFKTTHLKSIVAPHLFSGLGDNNFKNSDDVYLLEEKNPVNLKLGAYSVTRLTCHY